MTGHRYNYTEWLRYLASSGRGYFKDYCNGDIYFRDKRVLVTSSFGHMFLPDDLKEQNEEEV